MGKKLTGFIVDYIERELAKAITGSDRLQVVFSGLPLDLLELLFDKITVSGTKCLTVNSDAGEVNIPVFLLEDQADNPVDVPKAAKCTSSYFLQATRNNVNVPFCLALSHEGLSDIRSIESTVSRFGVSNDKSTLDEWKNQELITNILDDAIYEIFGVDGVRGRDVVEHALEEAWEIDERNRDKRTVWQVLETLCELRYDGLESHIQLSAILGFPSCKESEFGTKNYLTTLSRVGDFFQSNGLKSGFDDLEEVASDQILEHVKSFRSHIQQAHDFTDVSDFSSPLRFYRSLYDQAKEIPDWWHALSVDAWSTLLDSNSEPEIFGKLQVRVVDPVTAVPNGIPYLVRNKVDVEVSLREEETQAEVVVSRANGNSKWQELQIIHLGNGAHETFKDEAVPEHDRFLRYKFEADGHTPEIVKVIVLDSYKTGVVALCRNATKASPFKINRKAKENGKKVERYECDLQLRGMGSHQLDLYTSNTVDLGDKILGYEIDSEHTDPIERPINRVNENHSVCLVETDEQSYYEFSSGSNKFRINLNAEEADSVGATSEFDRLVIDHRGSIKKEISNARVEPLSCRAANLEEWILENEQSFNPLIFGPDFRNSWRQPDWSDKPLLSSMHMLIDPRPDGLKAPPEYLEARNNLFRHLKPSPNEQTPSANMLRLYDNIRNTDFADSLNSLLSAYSGWLSDQYDNAAWSDVVAIHGNQSGANSLDPAPYAVMLTPFHPVRLAWQCRAQSILQKAIEENMRCAGASMMDPSSFPDCLVLPCRSATGTTESRVFAAISTSSDYWSVLWSVDEIDRLSNSEEVNRIFGHDLGIRINGLSSGFSAQQVVRSIDEVSRLKSAKAELKIGISSDSAGAGSCNEGLDDWCSSNLGDEHDHWFVAGARSVTIRDYRDTELQPEQAALASLTTRTNAAVKWFVEKEKASLDHKQDLSIIAQLNTMNHEFAKQGIRSAVDQSGLTRWRIRKQLPQQNVIMIAESRIGKIPQIESDILTQKLLACVDALEAKCHERDSHVFAPNIVDLRDVVGRSWYTAISSTDVDAACFFGTTEKAYMWDYELPAYSRRAGENNGYYLLASESPSMFQAVRSALGLISNYADISDNKISELLEEISRRGMPTLKRLTTGGTMSLGEIGMLVALRLFQSEFEQGERPSLLEVIDAGKSLNLVIPADPFKNQFEDLRLAFEDCKGQRPDLLVLSIGFDSEGPICLKITPIEVKARGKLMSEKEKKSALEQARLFGDFLNKVKLRASESELWAVAFRGLIATLLDYGFRVYGQLEEFMQKDEWAKQHSAVLCSLASGNLAVDIDQRGRLVIIESSETSRPLNLDGDDFEETLVMSHKDAFSLLHSGCEEFVQGCKSKLVKWELEAVEQVDSGSGDEPVDLPDEEKVEPPSEPTENTTGLRFLVGHTIRGFTEEEVFYYPGNTKLNQLNVGVVGDLGTGKTQLIQGLIHQHRVNPEKNRGFKPNILIFDYKKDYSKPDFVEATGARVVKPFDIPLNLFDTRDLSQQKNAWLQRSKFFSDILNKIYSGIGPKQRVNIKEAVKNAYESSASFGSSMPTINGVFEAYTDLSGGSVDSPYSIMSDLVDGGYFVSDHSQVMPFSKFLEGIVVIDLAEVGQDDQTKNMLVVILLNLFYDHMLRIEKKPFIGKDPSLRFVDTMLLVDEADNIMKYEFDVLKRILLQGREFGVGVLLASQYLSHFRTSHENYMEPLLTWFIHKVPNINVKELEGIGLSNVDSEMAEAVKSLNVHECLYKSLDVDGRIIRGRPFFEM